MDIDLETFIFNIVDKKAEAIVAVIDGNFKVRYINDAICKISGKSPEFFLGRSIKDAFYDGKYFDEYQTYTSPLVEAMQTGRELRARETYLSSKNRVKQWFRTDVFLFRDAKGQPLYALGCYQQIDKYKELESKFNSMNWKVIEMLRRAVDARDSSTGMHSNRVAKLMKAFTQALGMTSDMVTFAYIAGIVHDIGKIGVPESILLKPGRLNEEEYNCIKMHPVIGAKILAEMEEFADITKVILHHHERYDGNGYPSGLARKDIPLFSRIMALCDSFEAMTGKRCYRQPMSVGEAIDEILRMKGRQFDPELTDLFVKFAKKTLIVKQKSLKAT